jgi:hypothetical protein
MSLMTRSIKQHALKNKQKRVHRVMTKRITMTKILSLRLNMVCRQRQVPASALILLVMLMTNTTSIKDVILFPALKRKE